MYDVIVNVVSVEEDLAFPWHKLWWKAIPSKISSFAWKVVREHIPTKDNLMIRGISEGLGPGSCSMCLGPLETSNHVLFSCLVALLVWQAISIWLNKPLSFSLSARDHFSDFVEIVSGNVRRKIFGLIWQATLWKIWKVRNRLIFKDSSYTLDELIDGIKFCSWKWIRSHYPLSFVVSFHDWDLQPLECLPSKL